MQKAEIDGRDKVSAATAWCVCVCVNVCVCGRVCAHVGVLKRDFAMKK